MAKVCENMVNARTVFNILLLKMVLVLATILLQTMLVVITFYDECRDKSLRSAYIQMYSHGAVGGSGWKRERLRKLIV